ncbi:hypothetical protein KNT87_gp063 [Erwinia phage Cronus]|uniref:Uncharacterized protein n=1 Tax=Erwinia phage Cronus TaxID=2163633 RepID=A0A2S1GM90_9CAUD|nr:hypothetical protein KNT87_gp063 [Erwinia phage Cronus]AWD90502.1 hypothetical protein [Erwinia phage Cronus]
MKKILDEFRGALGFVLASIAVIVVVAALIPVVALLVLAAHIFPENDLKALKEFLEERKISLEKKVAEKQ